MISGERVCEILCSYDTRDGEYTWPGLWHRPISTHVHLMQYCVSNVPRLSGGERGFSLSHKHKFYTDSTTIGHPCIVIVSLVPTLSGGRSGISCIHARISSTRILAF